MAGRITAIALALLVVIFSIAFYTINRGLRPLQLLARSADEVSRGNYDLEIRMRRNDEIGRLADAFARMLARIRGDLNGYQVCRYLVKDFGTSQSPKSTRQRDSRYCPDRPALITTPSRTLQQSCSCATPS
ncbi:MAG: HAMP domain-containing protein [Candidatus Sedimenticola endophacoides]